MNNDRIHTVDASTELKKGSETAFIDFHTDSNLAYKPEFIVNSYRSGRKVLSVVQMRIIWFYIRNTPDEMSVGS